MERCRSGGRAADGRGVVTAMSEWVSAEVLITHAIGLHARPSVKLTQLAKAYSCQVEIGNGENGPWIDAKSIVKVMALKARQDTVLYIRAQGESAIEAVAAIKDLVLRDFDEKKSNAGGN